MKIYTKKGDAGQTSLIGGTRVSKNHIRIEAYGTIDELNSFIGLLKDQEGTQPYHALLKQFQDNLFTIGSTLAADPETSKTRGEQSRTMKLPEITQEEVEILEKSMDEMEAKLPELKNFVLPGGHPANSVAHICRTVSRRAERCAVALNEQAEGPPIILQYLNRISDWFFVFARKMSVDNDAAETLWSPRAN